MFWVTLTILWLATFAVSWILGFVWAPLIVLIPIGFGVGIFIFWVRQQRRTQNGEPPLRGFAFIMHGFLPIVLLFLAYQLYAGMAPMQRVVVVEKTQTFVVTDHSDDLLIVAKYVATGSFFRYFLVVLLVGALAQGLYILARGYVPVEVALLVISALIAIWLFLPNVTKLDRQSADIMNALFFWGALATAIWSLVTGGLSVVSSLLQHRARMHPLVGLSAGIILAPVGILIALQPDVLITAMVTRLVHESSLTMDQALITMQQGALFGVFGPGALRELLAITQDLWKRAIQP